MSFPWLKAAFLCSALPLIFTLPSSEQANKEISGPSPESYSTNVSGKNALESLYSLGLHNSLPVGVVASDDTLCTHTFHFRKAAVSQDEFIETIVRDVPGYTAEFDQALLSVHPKQIPDPQQELLNLTLSDFRTGRTTHEEAGILIWIHVLAIYAPSEGTAVSLLGPTDPDTLEPFPGIAGTVQSLLDEVAATKKRGLWILHPLRDNWQQHLPPMPFRVYSYHDQPDAGSSMTCLEKADVDPKK